MVLLQIDQNYVNLQNNINSTRMLLQEEDENLSSALTEVNSTLNSKVRFLSYESHMRYIQFIIINNNNLMIYIALLH